MAKTKNIERLVEQHRAQFAELRARIDQLVELSSSERAWQTEAILFRAAVEWEVLSSQWLVATLNKSNAALKEFVLNEITRGFSDKYPEFAQAGHVEMLLVPPRHFNVSMVETLIDPSGHNNGFWARDHLKKWRRLMAPEYSSRVAAFHNNDWRVLNVLNSARNVIAHRSRATTRRLGVALDECNSSNSRAIRRLAPGSRQIQPSTIGAHFQATPSGGRVSRAVILLEAVDRVARKLGAEGDRSIRDARSRG